MRGKIIMWYVFTSPKAKTSEILSLVAHTAAKDKNNLESPLRRLPVVFVELINVGVFL